MSKAPAFQLYASDFMADPLVDAMTPEELGGYFRLLLVAWQQEDPGHLPNDESLLAAWSRLRERWEACRTAILRCFRAADDGRLYQKRMVSVAADQAVYREKQRQKGLASAAARGRNRGSTAVQPDDNHGSHSVQPDTQPEGNPPSPSPTPPETKRSLTRAKAPDQLWLEAVGLQPGAGLMDAWMLAKDAAPAKGKAPEAYFAEALGAFVAWVDGCKASRRPQKSPQKFVEHFARIQEILDGNRAAVPVETPAPLTHDPRSPLPSRPRDAVKPGEGGVRDLSRG
jgi:uncharacterized protein YdaU (DUF1376 family)